MKLYVTALLITGLLAGCNSNNKSAKSFRKKKSYSYSAKSGANFTQKSSSSKTIPEQAITASDTLEIAEDVPYQRERPGTNFQGASGVGTGGSYASSYYRQESMKKKKNKKEMYKNRNFDYMYQDANTAHLVLKKDSSNVSLKDSTSTWTIESDTTASEW